MNDKVNGGIKTKLTRIKEMQKTDAENKRAAQEFDAYKNRRMGAMDDLHYDTNEKGERTIGKWDKVASLGHKATEFEAVASFQDWRNSMSSILEMAVALNRAINADITSSAEALRLGVIEQLNQSGRDKADMLKEFYDEHKSKFGIAPTEIDLPKLVYTVKMDDKGELNFGNIVLGDTQESGANQDLLRINPELYQKYQKEYDAINNQFKILVNDWLHEKGYEKASGPNGKYFKTESDGTKSELTAQEFDSLKVDMQHDMQTYLHQRTGVEFEDSSSKPTI